jgi:predicted 3-demethylubiquinone-9 3-methyltransferase (glyoxalase superfamily)
MDKLITTIWCNHTAEEQAAFYESVLPDSRIEQVNRSPIDTPSGPAGQVLTVIMTIAGQRFCLLNGGPLFPQTEAVSFMILTDDQAETDRLWNTIVGNGGQESACGWCKDKWGVSWQVTPRRLLALSTDPDTAKAQRAMAAMMTMRKIDIATIEAAAAGGKADA